MTKFHGFLNSNHSFFKVGSPTQHTASASTNMSYCIILTRDVNFQERIDGELKDKHNEPFQLAHKQVNYDCKAQVLNYKTKLIWW